MISKRLWCAALCALAIAMSPSVALGDEDPAAQDQGAVVVTNAADAEGLAAVDEGTLEQSEPSGEAAAAVSATEDGATDVQGLTTNSQAGDGETIAAADPTQESDGGEDEPRDQGEDPELTAAVQPVLMDGGVYTFSANCAKDLKVGTESGSTDVALIKGSGREGDYWKAVASTEEDAYYLVNYNGNQSLVYETAESGADVQVVSGTGSLWVFTADDDGSVKISPYGRKDLALDVAGAKSSVGTKIHLYKSNNTAAQRFTFTLCEILTEALKNGKTAVPGVVTIQCSSNSSKVLDIKGGSKDNAANVQVYGSNDSFAQKFEMRYRGNGLYYFVSINSGKVLDVTGGSLASGANVQQYGFNGTMAQFWYLVADGDGYRIVNAKSGNVLCIAASSAQNGTNVQVGTADGSSAQRFVIKEVDILTNGGVYTIAPYCATGNVLSLSDNSTSKNAAVVTAEASEEVAGYWIVSLDGEGHATFTNLLSGYKLTAEDPSAKSAAMVSDSGISWKVVPNGDGTFSFVPTTNEGLAIDIKGASTSAGAAVQIWTSNGSKAQRFVLARYTNVMNAVKNGKTADAGVVSFAVSKNSAKVIDVAGGSMNEGANVQLYGSNKSLAQKYQLSYVGNGLYTIKNLKSGLYLSVKDNASSTGSNVQLESFRNVIGQCWYLVADGEGYVIRNARSGLALDAAGGKTDNATNIQIYTANGTSAQRYLVKEAQVLENDTYSFATGINPIRYFALEVYGGSTESGANVQLYKGNGTDAQKWKVAYVGNGAYTLTNVKSGLLLSVEDGSTENDANVCQLEDSSDKSQQWIIEYEVGGGYRFKNVKSGKYLDVYSAKAESGINVQQHNGNGTAAQLWVIKTDADLLPSGKLGTFIKLMVYYCDEVSVGYDQSNRWDIRDGGECDCSSLVIRCLEEAGFGAESAGATYTGNMRSVLTSLGWEVVAWDINNVQPGDILLNDEYHTCVVVSGNGKDAKIAQASIDENGNARGGKAGDQNGKETNIKTVYTYSYGWDCILRYVG